MEKPGRPGVLKTGGRALDVEGEKLKARLRSRMFGIESPPLRVGRYAVEGTIGAGGMGVVYAAHDDELDRAVAIKVMHATHTEDEGRLVREAQALAQLSHPNTVRVYEAGTFEGRVYVVMEFVDGPTLRAWQDEERRPWQEVLDKYAQAGRGLAAAHVEGIVHRDFKPANLLLGSDGRVRVVDFGLARAASELREPALRDDASGSPSSRLEAHLTRTGDVIGTPAYMSPEQVRHGPTDARSDQFSFCVALYEALLGRRPHEGDSAVDVLDAIEHGRVRKPPKWSGVPRRVLRIVMRGLDTNPSDRWPDMNTLLAALAGKRGGWIGLAALTGVAAVAVGIAFAADEMRCDDVDQGLDGIWDEGRRAEIQAAFEATGVSFAKESLAASVEELDKYAANWVAARRRACEATELRDLRVSCLERRAQKLASLTEVLAAADVEVVQRALESILGLPTVEACVDGERLRLGVKPPPTSLAERVQVIRTQIDQAESRVSAGRPREAADLAAVALDAARDAGYGPALAEALYQVAVAREALGHSDGVAEALLDAADLAEAHRHDALAADIWIRLVRVRAHMLSDAEGAQAAARRADAAIRRINNDPLRQAALAQALGLAYAAGGDLEASERHMGRAVAILEGRLGPDHPVVARALGNLARTMSQTGRLREASVLQRRARDAFALWLGEQHPVTAQQDVGFALVLAEMGRTDEARALHERALEVYVAAFGRDALPVGELHMALAQLDLADGQYAEVLRHTGRATEIQSLHLDAGDPSRARPLVMQANALHLLERWDEALAAYMASLELTAEPEPAALINVGTLLVHLGRPGEAVSYLERARDAQRRIAGEDDAVVAQALANLGAAYVAAARTQDAVATLQEAIELAERFEGLEVFGAFARFSLAKAISQTQRRRATAFAEEAEQMYRSLGSAHSDRADEIAAWLAAR